jgi:DNA mismatch endonuclease, patch repair protein
MCSARNARRNFAHHVGHRQIGVPGRQNAGASAAIPESTGESMASIKNRAPRGLAAVSQRIRKKAGHRSWAPRGGVVAGRNRGDIMSVATRSAVMARIRSENTSPEREIGSGLAALGLNFERHPRDIPGRPDILFRHARVAVFIDGDFWHGWRFPLWKNKLSAKWALKIASNRARDQRNIRLLRQLGWKVLRIWEHQIEQDPAKCIEKVRRVLESASVVPGRRRL